MNKAVFLDRDGVINEVLSHRVKFVNKPEQFYLLDGVGEAIRQLNESDFEVFVVTNQGGIGLGYMKEEMIHKIHDKMKEDLSNFGAKVTDVLYCPHKPKAGCSCRKPEPEMILRLAKNYNVDIKSSYMVGDRDVDIQAGKKAGVKSLLIGGEFYDQADEHFKDLSEAVEWILEQ